MTGRKPVSRRPLAVVGVIAVAVAVGVALGTAGVVANGPGEPISFYGGAADADGVPAPEGAVIVAAVDGTEVDRVTVEEAGVYATDGPTDEKLRTHTDAGDTVTFHVGDVDGPQAVETHDIDESGVFQLDLTFPAGTFDGDEGDTSSSGGAGGSAGTGGTTEESDQDDGSENRVTVELSPEVKNDTGVDGDSVVRSASVTVEAAANSTIEIDLVGDEEAPDGNESDQPTDGAATEPEADVEGIEIEVTEDVEVDLEIRQSADPPSQDAPEFESDDGTQPAGYLQIDTNLADDQIRRARIDFRLSSAALEDAGASPEDVVLYHYDEEAGAWEELPTTVAEVTDDGVRFSAATGEFSVFAAGIKRARFEIVDAAVDAQEIAAGDGIEVEVAVANTGGADGTFGTELWIDGDLVDESDLAVPADATRTAVLEHKFPEPGTYEVRVNDVSVGEVEVHSVSDDESEGQPPADDEQEGEAGDDGDSSDGPGGLPLGGQFVAVIALLAVVGILGAVVFVLRRR